MSTEPTKERRKKGAKKEERKGLLLRLLIRGGQLFGEHGGQLFD
jgi:hypothetical protein